MNKHYQAVHVWLRKNYGKADKCESADCNGKSKTYQWALIKGKEYDFIKENFIELCRSCHAKYDITDETRRKMRLNNIGRPSKLKGIKRSEAIRKKISQTLTGRKQPKDLTDKIKESNENWVNSEDFSLRKYIEYRKVNGLTENEKLARKKNGLKSRKLNPLQERIVLKLKGEMSQARIAKIFGVSTWPINRILKK